MSEANPQIVASVLQALQSTPEFAFLRRIMDEDEAYQEPEKNSYRFGVIAAVGAQAPRLTMPTKFNVGEGPEKYEQALSEAAVSIHASAAKRGERLSYAECRQQAVAKLGSGPQRADKYTERRQLDPEQRLSEVATSVHSENAARGRQLTWNECRAEAARRLTAA